MDSVRTETSTPTTAEQSGAVRQTAGAAADEAGRVAGTVADQARQVTGEVRYQVRSVAADMRDRVTEEARGQNEKLAEGLRQVSSELRRMASDREDSPARNVVMRLADSGHQAADYLSKHGPEGVLAEVQDFARRRPGAFLATALVSGFVVGRLGRGVFEASQDSSSMSPTDRYDTLSTRTGTSTMGTGTVGPSTVGTGTSTVGTGTSTVGTGTSTVGTTMGTGTVGPSTVGTGTSTVGTGTTGMPTSSSTAAVPPIATAPIAEDRL